MPLETVQVKKFDPILYILTTGWEIPGLSQKTCIPVQVCIPYSADYVTLPTEANVSYSETWKIFLPLTFRLIAKVTSSS